MGKKKLIETVLAEIKKEYKDRGWSSFRDYRGRIVDRITTSSLYSKDEVDQVLELAETELDFLNSALGTRQFEITPALDRYLTKKIIEAGKSVGSIRNGSVIDHIEGSLVWDIAEALNLRGETEEVSLGAGYPSHKTPSKKKGILKLGRDLDPGELEKIAAIAPNATISTIREWEVAEKYLAKDCKPLQTSSPTA